MKYSGGLPPHLNSYAFEDLQVNQSDLGLRGKMEQVVSSKALEGNNGLD